MGRPPRITPTQLLETARRVFVEKGYERTTLADIAGELGVTAAAVLRHFPSKHELFLASIRSGGIRIPDFVLALESVDASADPRVVLRTLAEQFVPFVQKTLALNLAVYQHNQAQTSFVVPFDTSSKDSPPRRGLEVVTGYFRRAAKAGVVRVRDPRAAALLFMGSLQSYVFLHQVLNIATKPYPLAAYIDQLIDVWTAGAIVAGGTDGPEETQQADADRADRPRARRRVGDRGVRDQRTEAEAGRPERNARGKNSGSGVAGGRPRRPRPRR